MVTPEQPVLFSRNGTCPEFGARGLHKESARIVGILLADDQPIKRRGLRSLLEREDGWQIRAEASDGQQAVVQAVRLRPDVVIVDLALPQFNGLEATRRILQPLPNARVLVLSRHFEPEIVGQASRAGASAYLTLSDVETHLIAAIKAMLQGRTFFPSGASSPALDPLSRNSMPVSHSALTSREYEIIQLVAAGNSNKQTAHLLNISSRTVENHRAQIMQKLALRSFSDLVRYAIRTGLLTA